MIWYHLKVHEPSTYFPKLVCCKLKLSFPWGVYHLKCGIMERESPLLGACGPLRVNRRRRGVYQIPKILSLSENLILPQKSSSFLDVFLVIKIHEVAKIRFVLIRSGSCLTQTNVQFSKVWSFKMSPITLKSARLQNIHLFWSGADLVWRKNLLHKRTLFKSM